MNFHGNIPAGLFGLVIICVVLLDAFETVVLPRRVTRQFRLTAWFYRRTWIPWKAIAGRIRTSSRQQNFLGYFGPLSLFLLLGFWAAGLILGFALLQYGLGGHEHLGNEVREPRIEDLLPILNASVKRSNDLPTVRPEAFQVGLRAILRDVEPSDTPRESQPWPPDRRDL